MNKIFDLHVHVNPDIIPRKYTAHTLAKELNKISSGAVLKSHLYNTVGIANCIREQGYKIYGSLVLNNYTGGLNIDIVKATIKASYKNEPFILYFPTFSHKNWTTNINHNLSGILESSLSLNPISYKGRLKTKVLEIIKLATYYNCPIATGHSNKNEVLLLCEEIEKNKGRLLLTHPCHPLIGFNTYELNSLLKNTNIYMEITLLMLLNGKQTFNNLYKILSTCNTNNICITSDLGQMNNMTVSAGYNWFAEMMKSKSYPMNNIDQLLYKLCWLNPLKFLGI